VARCFAKALLAIGCCGGPGVTMGHWDSSDKV